MGTPDLPIMNLLCRLTTLTAGNQKRNAASTELHNKEADLPSLTSYKGVIP